jgi:hypothetical protein
LKFEIIETYRSGTATKKFSAHYLASFSEIGMKRKCLVLSSALIQS